MRAMILAAGLGTRLRPLTNDRPKALVEVAGHTMLEIALRRLRSFGVDQVIVNTHHYADMMADYLASHKNFGMHVEVSREESLLDTGGGLKQAAAFLLDGDPSEPVILHNVDVLSTIDLGRMIARHVELEALATLAVQNRKTSRYLLFDQSGRLCGRKKEDDRVTYANDLCAGADPLAFSGIHILSRRIFAELTERGAFSIIDAYLRLARSGENIVAFDANQYYWRDLGRPDSVMQAALDLAEGRLTLDGF